jgi:hypothetical protein
VPGAHADGMRPHDHDHGSAGVVRAAVVAKGWPPSSERRNTGVSAIVRSACGPALRAVQRLTGRTGCEVPARLLSELPRRPIVRRCSSRSTSFVLAALRALQVDRCCARRDGQRSRNPLLRSGPTARFVSGLVPNQGIGDPVGAVGHRAADHAALLAAGPQLLAAAAGGRVGMPQPDAEVDQCPPQSHAAFPGDGAVTTLPGRLVLGWGQTGGPGELAGSPATDPSRPPRHRNWRPGPPPNRAR